MSESSRRARIATDFAKHQKAVSESGYEVGTSKMSVEDKLRVLEEMNRPDLIELFKEWKPRVSKRRRRGAPLDQRVSIRVTEQERASLDAEVRSIKKAGENISMSQFIRNRAIGSVDIQGWRAIAERALEEIEDTVKNQKMLRKKRSALTLEADNEDDNSTAAYLMAQVDDITRRLDKIVAKTQSRKNTLNGRMSMPESEQVKWRAQRLCISASDYLRMMIFGLEPDSIADSHMSLDAKRRFYISIIEVSNNGWGNPPNIYHCSQCENYMDEIRRLRSENEQLRAFS